MKKAFSLAANSFIILVAAILLIFAVMAYLLKSGLTESKNLENQYTAQRADIAMQGLIEAFGKTAEFFGILGTARELGAHGGISNTGISAASTYNPVMDAPGGIASWTAARCNNTAGEPFSTIRKRVPFVFYNDFNAKIGANELTYVIVDHNEYGQNMDDVKNGAYKFTVLVQVFFWAQGTVSIDICQEDRCLGAPLTMTESGVISVPFGNDIVANSDTDVTLVVSGSPVSATCRQVETMISWTCPIDEVGCDGEGGCTSAEFDVCCKPSLQSGIAALRQVSVSIYDKDVVADPSKLFEAYVNSYREGLPSKIEDLDIATNPYSAAFVPAGAGVYGGIDSTQGFSRGVIWAPDKISVSSPDAVLVKGFGIAEDDAKIRYFRIQKLAEFFTDNYEAWGKPRMWNQLNLPPSAGVGDHFMPAPSSTCGQPTYANCPPDDLKPTSEDFRVTLEDSLAPIEIVLNNNFASEGFTWELRIPAATFKGCNLASTAASASYTDAVCNTANMEYYRYKSGWLEFDKCDSAQCPQSCGSSSSCSGKESTCDKDAHGCRNSNKCFMHYDHRYVFKNIPVQVTIIDDKYKMFDAATNSWVPYKFTFFVEVDRIDDDACDSKSGSPDHVCSTQSGPAPTFMTEPSVVVPVELINPPKETCYDTAGQSCEYGPCPRGWVGGSGTCGTGKTCCAEAVSKTCSSFGGTCYALAACPAEKQHQIPIIEITDCWEPGKICCTAESAAVETYIALKYQDTFGAPQGRGATLSCKKLVLNNVQTTDVTGAYDSEDSVQGFNYVRFKFTKNQMQQLKDAGCTW